MSRQLQVKHATLYALPATQPLNYFGWPTVARLSDGTLVAGASGFRASHICPFGVSVLWYSSDEGQSWSKPEIVNDSPIDDRDVGLTPLPDGKLLISWFAHDIRSYFPGEEPIKVPWNYRPVLQSWEQETVDRNLGSFIRIGDATKHWGPKIPVPVSSPHGPTRLADGTLLYLGSPFGRVNADGKLEFKLEYFSTKELQAFASTDGGLTWQERGGVKPPESDMSFCEPHAIELPDGKLLGVIREDKSFSIWQTESTDGGRNWTPAHKIVEKGSPPHLLRHSSGILILSYGYRSAGFGQRVRFSDDNGASWSDEWIIRDDGPSGDLGYPSSVELSDGSILTVYYQAPAAGEACAILTSRWSLPKR